MLRGTSHDFGLIIPFLKLVVIPEQISSYSRFSLSFPEPRPSIARVELLPAVKFERDWSIVSVMSFERPRQ